MLDRIIAEHWLTATGTVGLWRCRREGDDVFVARQQRGHHDPFPPPAGEEAEGRPNMCLADFIAPEGEDWIGGFAVAIHGLEPHSSASRPTMTIIRTSC
jgi:5-methyltetrahydrofolate--homocysteine methyltransferase